MTETANQIFEAAELLAAQRRGSRAIAAHIIEMFGERRGTLDEPAFVLKKLDAYIGERARIAEERDHPNLQRGVDVLREAVRDVRRTLGITAPSDASTELEGLAEKIRVCIKKSDNYATTAGKYLREARDRCRQLGRDFDKWCAGANLGFRRSRIYQLMGPDPITAARRDEKHIEPMDNVQPLDIAQLEYEQPLPPPMAEELEVETAGTADGPLPPEPEKEQSKPAVPPIAAFPHEETAGLCTLPFEVALGMFEAWLKTLGPTQWAVVDETMKRVDAELDRHAAAELDTFAASRVRVVN